jgi:hypothetical protein
MSGMHLIGSHSDQDSVLPVVIATAMFSSAGSRGRVCDALSPERWLTQPTWPLTFRFRPYLSKTLRNMLYKFFL